MGATARVPFDKGEIETLGYAISISEEIISDHYKLSTSQWKRYRYDIQSLRDLEEFEIIDEAFAQIHRYARSPHHKLRGSEAADYFKICLQDHVIRHAVQRDRSIDLLPLATYIATHELIHVVRFAKFIQRFDTSFSEREAEEARVHALTHHMLCNRKIQGLQAVLAAFKDCRTMETFTGMI